MGNPITTFLTKVFPDAALQNVMSDPTAFYDMLEGYYNQNGLYDSLMSANYYLGTWHENMKPLRNPANRSVEFFVPRLMPGNLPDSVQIIAENERIIEPIHNIWKWSNLNANKSIASRWLSIYGDLFIHPTANDTGTQVYLQFLKPHNITDWVEDTRGNTTWIRLDIQISPTKWQTECWDTEYHKIWQNTLGKSTSLDADPTMIIPLVDYGIDFVPFVHTKFRDVGEKHGISAFGHCLDKIDEANRMATRLHEMMFRHNKPYIVLSANDKDESGAPKPPPLLTTVASKFTDKNAQQIPDEAIFKMPGLSTVDFLVPDLNYQSFLAVVQDHMNELEKDLPELAMERIKDKGELSGKAVRLMLTDAITRAEEARSNWEQGLIRAENMALTMGNALNLFGNIGSYDAGEFEHTYDKRDIFPVSEFEKAEIVKTYVEAGMSLASAMKMAGFEQTEIDDVVGVTNVPVQPQTDTTGL